MNASTPPIRMDHVAVVVQSVERSTQFYARLLGVDVLECVDLDDHRIQYLASGTGVRLELIEYRRGEEALEPRGAQTIGMRHIAWQVDDLPSVLSRIGPLGGTTLTEPTWIPELGFYSALIRDPDGVEVELVQRT